MITDDMKLVKCRICGKTPDLPELWTDASGNHSESCVLACYCGVQIVEKMQHRYAAVSGDTGWTMISGEWDICVGIAVEKWNKLMGE
jgi:hypothetical protein